MHKFFSVNILVAAILFFVSCTGSRLATQNAGTAENAGITKKQMKPLLEFANQQLNVPYKWGGSSPKGFDCSGFTVYCYKHFGVQLPRTTIDQSQTGQKIRSKKAKAGDLIFFQGSDQKQKKVGHVGIVVSGKKRNIKFIHAATNGVMVSILSEDYYSTRFKTIRRIRK